VGNFLVEVSVSSSHQTGNTQTCSVEKLAMTMLKRSPTDMCKKKIKQNDNQVYLENDYQNAVHIFINNVVTDVHLFMKTDILN